MQSNPSYAVVGGDLRQARIANRLSQQGKPVKALLLEGNTVLHPELAYTDDLHVALTQSDIVILPIPLTSDDQTVRAPFSRQTLFLSDCFRSIRPDAPIFAGRVTPAVRELASQYRLTITDYLECEELAVQNAAITAEGALAIAIEESSIALFQSRCLITGHGRIARALMRILQGFGARVSVAARKYGDLAEIRAQGCVPVPIFDLGSAVPATDLIFNTVPAPLFTREILARLSPGALLIDLASKPGGADSGFAQGA